MNAKFHLCKLTSESDRISGSATPEALLVVHMTTYAISTTTLWSPTLSSTFTHQETEAQRGTLSQFTEVRGWVIPASLGLEVPLQLLCYYATSHSLRHSNVKNFKQI